jgi:class 3 adenylate cyclase/tetratricopeptide (TPR) repeat protein
MQLREEVSVFQWHCHACGSTPPVTANFCGQCGADLRARAVAPRRREAELRLVSILFCDLVDSTSLAASIEPELWRNILVDYQRAVEGAVSRFGGHVARVFGDGFLVYFGWPTSYEDDAERAVRSSLAIVAEMGRLNRSAGSMGRPLLHVRIALHRGKTLIDGAGEAFGETPHLAARAQAVAGLDSVIVTDAVREAVALRFDLQDIGPHSFKGIAEAVRLHRVSGLAPGGGADRKRPSLRLFGRSGELQRLCDLWDEARAGRGGLVVLSGEAGIGKSRLVAELHQVIAGSAPRWLEARAAPYYATTPLHPLVQLLDDTIGRSPTASEDGSDVQKVRRLLEAAGIHGTDSLATIANFLGLRLAETPVNSLFGMADARRHLLSTLVGWIGGAQPTVFLLEDAHWADPSTLELLDMVAAVVASRQLLVIVTQRPGAALLPSTLASSIPLALRRLDADDLRELVVEVTGADVVSETRLRAVVERTAGIPLFAVEFCRLLRKRDESLQDIPVSLAASLTNRLAQLGEAQRIAQLCAVVGLEADYGLLAPISDLPEAELQRALLRLVDAEILQVTGEPPRAIYRFHHALFQQVAYEGLLPRQRQSLHRRLAQLIETRHPEIAASSPGTLARHWAAARELPAAVSAWAAAAAGATGKRAFKEARDAHRQALEVLMSMLESPERDSRELEIRFALYAVLQITEGYSGPDQTENWDRARQLTERSGDVVKLISLATGSWAALSAAGDYVAASRVAEEVIALARRDGGPENLAHAHMAQVTALSRVGELRAAEDSFLAGEPYFSVTGFRQRAGVIAQTYGNGAKVAALLGRCALAVRRNQHTIDVAVANNNPFDLAFASYMCASNSVTLRHMEAAREHATRAIALADEHRYPQFAAIARVALGRAIAELEDPVAGVALMREGLAGQARNGARAALTVFLAWLAEAYELGGRTSEALETIRHAFVANPEERLYNAEALRIRGWLLVGRGDFDTGEADVRDALRLATETDALRFRLRAATTLSAIVAGRGRTAEAFDLLEEVCSLPALETDDVDVRDARQQLDRLRGQRR